MMHLCRSEPLMVLILSQALILNLLIWGFEHYLLLFIGLLHQYIGPVAIPLLLVMLVAVIEYRQRHQLGDVVVGLKKASLTAGISTLLGTLGTMLALYLPALSDLSSGKALDPALIFPAMASTVLALSFLSLFLFISRGERARYLQGES